MIPVISMAAKTTVKQIPVNQYYDNNYATIKLGMFVPNNDSDGLEDFDNGFAIGGAIGHKFNRNFAVELGLDYSSTESSCYNLHADVETWDIPITAKLILPVSHSVDFFVGGGFGLYFTDINVDFDEGFYKHDDSESALGFHVLIGADIKMDHNVAFTMELKHTGVEQDFREYGDWEVGGTTVFVGAEFLFR
jgi:opacity protein-like surface antigen